MTKPVSRKMAVDCLLWFVKCLYGPVPCYLCLRDITAAQDIQFDHAHAIVHEGPHEYQNLRPVHAECHKKKTARDIAANAKVKRLANPKPSKRPMAGGKQSKFKRKMNGHIERRS